MLPTRRRKHRKGWDDGLSLSLSLLVIPEKEPERRGMKERCKAPSLALFRKATELEIEFSFFFFSLSDEVQLLFFCYGFISWPSVAANHVRKAKNKKNEQRKK